MAAMLRKFVVGLTGGIGSGKSSAAACFEKLGALVIDADAISHALTVPHGPAISQIDAAFPGVVNDGVLDRARLRERVFAAPAERERLEAIVHPMVRARTSDVMRSAEAQRAPYIIHMVPLLFESKDSAQHMDCAVVVDVDEATQIERVSRTRNVPTAMVQQIINAQMPREERLLHAQFVIDNRGDQTALERQVVNLHSVFVANAARLAGSIA
jgi:dephospho-CoA kinase